MSSTYLRLRPGSDDLREGPRPNLFSPAGLRQHVDVHLVQLKVRKVSGSGPFQTSLKGGCRDQSLSSVILSEKASKKEIRTTGLKLLFL